MNQIPMQLKPKVESLDLHQTNNKDYGPWTRPV